jgi:hypothetical protein
MVFHDYQCDIKFNCNNQIKQMIPRLMPRQGSMFELHDKKNGLFVVCGFLKIEVSLSPVFYHIGNNNSGRKCI